MSIPVSPNAMLHLKAVKNRPAAPVIQLNFDQSDTDGNSELKLKPGSLYLQKVSDQTNLIITLGDPGKVTASSLRAAGGRTGKWLVDHSVTEAWLDADSLAGFNQIDGLRAFLEGLRLGAYTFSTYRNPEQDKKAVLVQVSGDPELISEVEIVSSAVILARDLSHEPASVINPLTMSEKVLSLAREAGLACRVLDEKELKDLGAGAILAVGQGSRTPPRMVAIEYPGTDESSEKPILLIGKTLTFDSGGYSIKESNGMVGMKYDKCGGIAVLAAVLAAARLKLPQPVVGVLGIAENMLSENSYRPDDILTSLSGKTIEVVSTDAEGRLVLADTLTWAEKTYQPRCIIDLATLTGGVVVALGHLRAGILGIDQALIRNLIDSGERTGEKLWELPLDEEYFDALRNSDADMKNSAGREASTITGAIFLRQFVSGKTPWAHIDIAGVATANKELPLCSSGATGFGVRLLIDYLKHSD